MNWYARNIALPLVLFLRDHWPWLLRIFLGGSTFHIRDEDDGFEDRLAEDRARRKAILSGQAVEPRARDEGTV